MGERTRLGLGVMGAALVLGGLGDALLRATPWGVNFLLWVTALAGTALLLDWRSWNLSRSRAYQLIGSRGESAVSPERPMLTWGNKIRPD